VTEVLLLAVICTTCLIHLVLLSDYLSKIVDARNCYRGFHGQSRLIYFVPTNWIDADFL